MHCKTSFKIISLTNDDVLINLSFVSCSPIFEEPFRFLSISNNWPGAADGDDDNYLVENNISSGESTAAPRRFKPLQRLRPVSLFKRLRGQNP